MIERVIEGKALIRGRIEECCIGVEGGRIVSLKKILEGEERIRIRRGLILPAGVDLHVHFREPGFKHKEDFSTGSLSALYGGITCVADMPNTDPPTLDRLSLKEKILLAGKKSFVDFLIYVGITDGNLDRLDELSSIARIFKIYLGETTGNLCFRAESLERLREMEGKKLLVFHAEDRSCLEDRSSIARDLKGYARSRPKVCEALAIRKILESLGRSKHRLHISHISSLLGLRELEHREDNVTVGVTPHHLFFNVIDDYDKGTFIKVNPPIRGRIDQEGLMESLINGDIDILESDHAPHAMEEKLTDFESAPCGIPNVETMYPLLIYYFLKKGLPLDRLVRAIAEKPAEILGVRKGKIEEGMDADLAVFNLKEVRVIRDEDLHYKCGYSPFSGYKAIFPEKVFIRGEEGIDGEDCLIDKGFGRYLG